jgi:helicase
MRFSNNLLCFLSSKTSIMDETLRLALDTIKINKQAIIFCPSRASAEKCAEDIAKLLAKKDPSINQTYATLQKKVLSCINPPTKQCKRLATAITQGIAFHHSGLHNKQKEIVEDNFKVGNIKIICATPTLAAGLSLPVFRVIIKSLKRYSGKWGMDWIPVLEYLQMAGRAGRPEYETFGEAIVIAKNEDNKEEIYQRYICGEAEDIYSKLAVEPVLRMYVLSLIASGIIRDTTALQEFFSKTFWAAQFGDMQKLELITEKMLDLLKTWEFVTSNDNTPANTSGFTSALSLLKKKNPVVHQLRATQLGKRVSQLYLDPLTARELIDRINFAQSLKTEKKIQPTSFSYLQMISHTLEMRPLLRIKVAEQDLVQEQLLAHYEDLLEKEPAEFDLEYHDFMNSIKTTLFFTEWINEVTEDKLLEKMGVRPGEIRYKLENADWLLYASFELSSLLGYKEITNDLRKLRIRVKHGIKEELLTFMKLKGIGRIRSRKLFSNGIKDMGDLKRIDMASLGLLIGKKLAIDIKNQLGEKIEKVPDGKRKGQLGLGKF